MIGELLERRKLGSAEIAEMYRLFSSHFERVSESRFRADLAAKDWVIRIRDDSQLLGFTSVRLLHRNANGKPLDLIYSGDTIVKPEARSTTLLARTWIDSVRRIGQWCGNPQLHWLLLVSGFRTYRLLPVFWKEFYPSYRGDTPVEVRSTMSTLAASLFGPDYLPDAGVVRFREPQPLRPELACIPDNRFDDPHVQFFAGANPGHFQGDELVCWARLSEDNLTAAGARMWSAADCAPIAVRGS